MFCARRQPRRKRFKQRHTAADEREARALLRQRHRHSRTDALSGPGYYHVASLQNCHAGSFTAGAAAMAFSRAKIDSICPLPDTYCFGQASGV